MPYRTILHLIDTGGPGGAETIFANLVERLDRERWHSIAAVTTRGWLHDHLRAHGIDPILVPSRGSFDLSYLLRLVRLSRRHRVELVQAHLLTSGVYGSLSAFLSRTPVVCTFHGTPDIAPQESFRAIKLRILDRPSNRVVFVSDALRRAFLLRGGLDREHTEVIHNGIDLSRFRRAHDTAVRQELNVSPDEILVGAVGNVRPAKDYRVLLHAAALLRDRSRRYRFVIAGDARGPLGEELRALRAALGLENSVAFLGLRDDVPRLLNNLDLYVSTSSSEGFSLTTAQAMACGVPVVVTRCGGPEEIVEDGISGSLVPVRSPEAIARAIDELAADADRRRRLAQAGRERVHRKFTVEAMVRNYEALYVHCLSGGRGNAPGSQRADLRLAWTAAPAGAPRKPVPQARGRSAWPPS